MNQFDLFQFEFIILMLMFVFMFTYKKAWLGIVAFILSLFLAFFTRGWYDGEEHLRKSNVVISPCEGEIIEIKDVLDQNGKQLVEIVFFLNIHNIHLQYAPIDATVISQKSRFGYFKPAKWPIARQNYKITTVLDTKIGEVVLEQISGFLVRKIKSFKQIGDRVRQGEALGMIKFGSRCQLYLPRDKVNLRVKIGQQVRIGEVLGHLF